jgi:hypothetical protein
MKKIWARIGMTAEVSDEEYRKIKELTNSQKDGDLAKGQLFISKLLREKVICAVTVICRIISAAKRIRMFMSLNLIFKE